MRNKKLIAVITCVWIAMIGVLIMQATVQMDKMPISLEVSSENEKITLSAWEDEDTVYFFLPSYAELTTTEVKLQSGNVIKIDNRVVENGMNCAQFSVGKPYRFSYYAWGREYEKNLILLHSDGLATVFIDTQSTSMEYLHDNKANSEPGTICIVTESGVEAYRGGLASISCRGNASWTETEKKSYGITLEEPSDLLNLGTAGNWILLANALDGSYLRNKIVHDAANEIGLAYTADSTWIDLYLNGEYAGLYQLSERNEVHPERVDILPEGSFLLSGEMESRLVDQNIPYIATDSNQALRIHYPKTLSDTTAVALKQRLQSAENAILADDNIDPITGKRLEDLIDLDSFVKKYLIDEVFGNIDGGAFSQFYYFDGMDRDSKLYAGPVWDYDLSMGSDFMWQIQNPEALYVNRPSIKPGIEAAWMYHLCQKTEFHDQVVQLYQTKMLPFFEILRNKVDAYMLMLDASAYMDKLRWDHEKDLQTQIQVLLEYLDQRQTFLNDLWLSDETFHCVTFIQGNGQNNAYYLIRSGQCVREVPDMKSTEQVTYKGWYYVDTDEPFDAMKPITEDIEIYAKWEEHSSKRFSQIGKLMPLGVIAVMGIVLLVVDIKKCGKAGGGK